MFSTELKELYILWPSQALNKEPSLSKILSNKQTIRKLGIDKAMRKLSIYSVPKEDCNEISLTREYAVSRTLNRMYSWISTFDIFRSTSRGNEYFSRKTVMPLPIGNYRTHSLNSAPRIDLEPYVHQMSTLFLNSDD